MALAAPEFAIQIWQGMQRLLYPNLSIGCHSKTAGDRLPLCIGCRQTLERADRSEIATQFQRLPTEAGFIQTVFALWRFKKDSPLQHLHHALKYHSRPGYGFTLGEYMGEALRQENDFTAPDFIAPVPLHPVRLYERGYNQSALLAQGIARCLDGPLCRDLLTRRRTTAPQAKLSRVDRWENVRQAFSIQIPGIVQGRRVLLVDDILTTGATVAAAALPLHEAGAIVDVAVLAYAHL